MRAVGGVARPFYPFFLSYPQAYDLRELRVVAAKVHQLNPMWSEARKASYVKHAIREVNIQKVGGVGERLEEEGELCLRLLGLHLRGAALDCVASPVRHTHVMKREGQQNANIETFSVRSRGRLQWRLKQRQ